MPLAKNIREFNFGSRGKTTKNSTSRQVNFNNTQKINIEEHLDGMHAIGNTNKSKIYTDKAKNHLKKNPSNNKFRLILSKNKANTTKYSYIGNSGIDKGLEKNIEEYKGYSNKTPSHNSRIIYKNSTKSAKMKYSGDKSHSYSNKQKRAVENYPVRKPEICQVRKKERKPWQNMTQNEIFGYKSINISGISPSSTKNYTSHYMKFNLNKENNLEDPCLELPDGLKDIGDSDLEVGDYDESPVDNTGEELSFEENHPKCFTKSKIELFQTNIKENHFMNKTQYKNAKDEEKYRGAVDDMLPNQDTVGNIGIDFSDKQLQNFEEQK